MFSNLFFLILVLFIVNLAPEAQVDKSLSPLSGFLCGLGFYALLLILIFWQNRFFRYSQWLTRSRLLVFANIEILLFLLIYHFLLGAHRLYYTSEHLLWSQTALALVSLALYFGALAVYHYTTSSYRQMVDQLRFLFPFAIPFLLFSIAGDIVIHIPYQPLQDFVNFTTNSSLGALFLIGLTFLFLLLLIMMLPPIIIRIWQCVPLQDLTLKARLEAFCQRAHFKHAGMLVWTVMNPTPTAAIIGVIPPFRYVMFTQSLLNKLPEEEVEAVLAHEIGHSYRKHLLIYPLIFFGVILLSGTFFLFTGTAIHDFFALHLLLNPNSSLPLLYPLAILIPYALIFALYFRLVFGYFSRHFERQADLHVFHLNVPPEALVNSLDRLGAMTGNSHKQPSWHHYSIEQRINQLNEAVRDPSTIPKHHRKVKRSLILYGLVAIGFSILLFAPFFPKAPLFGPLATWSNQAATYLSGYVNRGLEEKLIDRLIAQNHLNGNETLIRDTLKQSFQEPSAMDLPGALEFYGAQNLVRTSELQSATRLMERAWDKFDFKNQDASALDDFDRLTQQIIDQLDNHKELAGDKRRLIDAMTRAKVRMKEG